MTCETESETLPRPFCFVQEECLPHSHQAKGGSPALNNSFFEAIKTDEMQINMQSADYVFLGAGASATLLLMSMEKHGLLTDKKVVILDPDEKNNNDKTYCFWSSDLEDPARSCLPLISHRWDKINVNRNGDKHSSGSKKYHHISSIDLYNEQRRIIEAHQIQRLYSAVEQIESDGNLVKISSIPGSWISEKVFDSRTPRFKPVGKDDAHLHQSFLGYVVELQSEQSAEQSADLMDFDVEQDGATQFMYVLPFSKNKMLVEVTRFGVEKINEERAKTLLDNYIRNRFGAYQIVDTERGCIPMSTAAPDVESIPCVIPIGSRAGALKPSTGYAFKTMYFHAESVCRSLLSQQKPKQISRPLRFRLYDRLLLLILLKQPFLGKTIFESLFRKNALADILRFLDEKTSIVQEIKIFSTLPVSPFLKALGWVAYSRCQQHARSLSVLLLTALLILLQQNLPQYYEQIQWILFAAGLLMVGIPHGAIDHLLETNNLYGKIKVGFILKYIGLAVLYFLVWAIAPLPALLFFVLFSAWHFGQADALDWKFSKFRPLVNLVWGCNILTVICLGHIQETNYVLQSMKIQQLAIGETQAANAVVLLVALSVIWALAKSNLPMLLGILAVYFATRLPLVSAFGLYFVGQHSLIVWSHLKKSMSTGNLALYTKALPFTAGAVLLFGMLAYCYQAGILQNFESQWLTLFFVFISCISFPHVMAMSSFYDNVFFRKQGL